MASESKICVNPGNGKHSYIAIVSPDAVFTRDTDVASVRDNRLGLSFTAQKKWKNNPRIFPIKLTGTLVPSRARDLEQGTLTITLVSGPNPPDVPVVYVDD